MADFTWITHSLWVYEPERKKETEQKPEKVGVSANRTTTDRPRPGPAERRDTASKN